MLKGIVFDLDGTLVDSLKVSFDAFNHGIVGCGGRQHTPQEIMRYFGTGEGQIFAQIVGEERAEEAYELSRAFTEENMGKVPLHDGIDQLLELCRGSSVPIAIVTGRSWPTTEIILKHHGLLDRFITVIASDHVNSSKPSPEGLRLALSRMGLEPGEAVYVGDSPMDVMAAHRAGTLSVAALWDLLAKREHLAPMGPHHWAVSPAEVWTLWRKLSGSS